MKRSRRSGRRIGSLAVILLVLMFAGVQADAAGVPDLTISKSHNGNFTRGRSGASYTLTVTNIGSAATTQIVTVTDTLPVGLTATDISGTGWSCTLLTLTCTRSDALGVFPNMVSSSPQPLPRAPVPPGTYPVITVTVTVAGDTPSSVTNQASVSGGGESNTSNDSASDVTAITGNVIQPTDLTIAKSHAGSFIQGQIGATYTLTVSNTGGASSGVVTVVDTLPAGLTASDISGTGWSCTLLTLTCTRSDVLNSSYPVITVTVNVSGSAAASITNTASVSGGGETNTSNDSASDVTTVTQVADLTISKSHTGNFTQGQIGATYTLIVSNTAGVTNGTVTVTDTLPGQLTASDISGTGWNCVLLTLTCTRNDTLIGIPNVLAGPAARAIAHGVSNTGSYPAITVTVDVAKNSNSAITNIASVSGGGEINTDNDSASDVTNVTQLADLTISKSHTGNFSQGQVGATYTLSVGNRGFAGSTGTVTVTDILPAGLTATDISGTGWDCILETLTCTRNDTLDPNPAVVTRPVARATGHAPFGGSYPAITITVNVAHDAASSITNSASVSGGGEVITDNDSTIDVTTVGAPIALATTTALVVSPDTSVNAGATLTFTVTVQQSSTAVTPGVVNFCDANASHCTGTALLGTVQLTSGGTAALSRVLGVGTYNVKAVFAGTPFYSRSESEPQSLIVTGNGGYGSTTTITSSGSVNSYTLTGTVIAFGKPIPTGSVSFVDMTTGNSVLGTATLDPNSRGFTMTPATAFATVDGASLPGTYGDFNNDGKIDLAIPDGSTNKVSVLLGNGDGTFQTAVTYPTDAGGRARAIAEGDFNGDGNQDLAVTNLLFCDRNTVSILLGNGDGTFQPQVSYGVGYQAYSIVAGDFNGDGDADLAVANRDDNNISVMLGNGDGTFQPQTTLATGSSPISLATGELNDDGQIDLIAVNSGDNTVSVLLGNGDGTFQSQAIYALGNAPVSLAVTDLNGDGNADLAVTNSTDNTISILIGNGDGTFLAQTTLALANSPGPLTVGDFDGDGNPDLSAISGDGTVVNVLLGKGDGTFKDAVTFPVIPGSAALTGADFNGDGLTDLATLADGDPNAVRVLLSQHTETARSTGVALSGSGTHDVFASYAGDDSHEASQSETIPLAGPEGTTTTTTTLTASPSPVNAGQTVTFTATVSPAPTGSPAGTVSFYSGSTLLGSSPVNGSGISTLTNSSFTAGTKSITAVYSGNTAFAASTSSPLSLTVQSAPVFTITAPQTPFTVKAGGSVDVHIVVPPVGGSYNSLVTMSATGLPPGAAATFNPGTVTPGDSGAPTVLTIQTAAASASLPANPAPRWPFAAISMAAAFVFIGKSKRLRKKVAMRLLTVSVIVGALTMTGCNAGSVGKPVPQSHTYVITITGTSGNLHPSTTIKLIVQ